MWSGVLVDGCSPEEIKKNQTLKLGPAMAAKPPFNVVIDLSLRKRPLVEFMTHLFLWVRQRRDKLHLCCNRLKIVGKPTSYTRKVLRLLQLDSVQKVEVHCAWAPFTLAACAPFFSQMRNLRKLLVSKIYVSAYTSQKEQEQLLAQLTSQFLRMDCLQKFCANALILLEGHLEQAPEDPPETLSITNCPLSDSDWNYLSRYPNTRQLRHLELRGIKLTDFSLEPLQILLDSTATTLNMLDLATSCITDSQLQALLPALSRCSQLVILSIHGNHLSMSTLRDLLLHTARLSHLSVELYSAPLESYDARGTIHPGRCSQLCAELTAIVGQIDVLKDSLPQTIGIAGLVVLSCSSNSSEFEAGEWCGENSYATRARGEREIQHYSDDLLGNVGPPECHSWNSHYGWGATALTRG
ncbi:PRAME family member 5-like [Ictidomys tridecemlineatus]